MYIELKLLMLKNGISTNDIAELLKIHRNTVANKINGSSDFTISEIKEIQNTFFNDVEFETICKNNKGE